jgi:hypothetical protein
MTKDSVRIWHYMDFAKFIRILLKSELFFSSITKFEDPWEGHASYQAISKLFRGSDEMLSRFKISNESSNDLSLWYHAFRSSTCVSCWHQSNFDSDAMWKIYSSGGFGVAISTTVSKLRGLLKKENMTIDFVKYINDNDFHKEGCPVSGIFLKRNSFAHEKEIRGVIFNFDLLEKIYKKGFESKFEGIDVPIDLSNFIEEIKIDPRAESWFKTLVKMISSEHGMGDIVSSSNILQSPFGEPE